jgi:YidC/Oxa1 family membrane protein insertase
MGDQKNTILAIVLSAIVLIGWQYFVGIPKMEKQRQEAAQQQLQLPPAPGTPATPGAPVPAGAAPQVPGQATAPVQTLTREAVIASSPRIGIETPSLQGSIALKGGRIDDLSLVKYRETVDPKSPAVDLLSPSGSPNPF